MTELADESTATLKSELIQKKRYNLSYLFMLLEVAEPGEGLGAELAGVGGGLRDAEGEAEVAVRRLAAGRRAAAGRGAGRASRRRRRPDRHRLGRRHGAAGRCHHGGRLFDAAAATAAAAIRPPAACAPRL